MLLPSAGFLITLPPVADFLIIVYFFLFFHAAFSIMSRERYPLMITILKTVYNSCCVPFCCYFCVCLSRAGQCDPKYLSRYTFENLQ